MIKIEETKFSEYISIAKKNSCGNVYPMAIAEGFRFGEIFADSSGSDKNVLFWANNGFAYLSEQPDAEFLEEVYMKMADPLKSRRFVLLTDEISVKDYFQTKPDVMIEPRYLFRYDGSKIPEGPIVPKGYQLVEFDESILKKLDGKIIPQMFWKDTDTFLKHGKGYALIFGDEIATWAFSAAVSSDEIDIGIETSEKYRKQGLPPIVVTQMIRHALEQGKMPVWACYYKNIPSAKIAERTGFRRNGECFTIKQI